MANADEKKTCPLKECDGTELSVLLFMGVQPDGYVCPKCKTYFDPDNLKPLARVL